MKVRNQSQRNPLVIQASQAVTDDYALDPNDQSAKFGEDDGEPWKGECLEDRGASEQSSVASRGRLSWVTATINYSIISRISKTFQESVIDVPEVLGSFYK